MFITLILAALAFPASARVHSFRKQVVPHVLQSELKAAGFKVDSIGCRGMDCVVRMPNSEGKDPSKIIEAHDSDSEGKSRRSLLAELAAIESKLDSKTDTEDDRRRALKILLLLGWPRN